MHSVCAYKMIFAVLECWLIQLLKKKWLQFLSIIFAVLLIIY